MIIDINGLTTKKILRQVVDISFQKEDIFDGSERVLFTKPISINGSLNLVGDIINFDALLSTEVKLVCSRCLDTFTYPLEIEVHESFTSNPDNKDDEIILIDGDEIDITDVVESNIILALPMKRLCKEDCKGLCQQCGANLNRVSCNCKHEDIDPRLAKLKDLFSAN